MKTYDLKAVKRANPIENVARESDIEVINHRARCFCPENHQHGDRTPSLSFDVRSNTFRCWVCKDVHGDVINLVMMKLQLSFQDAVKLLADRAGISPTDQPLPLRNHAPAILEKTGSGLGEFLELDLFFLSLLFDLTPAMCDWLDNRGDLLATALKLGTRALCGVNKVIETLLSKYPLEQLQRAGYFNAEGKFIFWRHRLIWVWTKNGLPTYFQGRTTRGDVTPKEMCLARPIPYPFNIDCLESKPEEVFICEGVVDTLTLLKNGKAAVGVAGANGFKDAWLPWFRGCRVKVAFDADAAGHSKGAELVQKFCSQGIDANRVYLPVSYDVNQYFQVLRQFGKCHL